jgi:hypothetical protein
MLTVLVCLVTVWAARTVARRFLPAPTAEHVFYFVMIFTAHAGALLWERPRPRSIARGLLFSLLIAALAVAAFWAIERYVPFFAG